jgi:hypothetical protein
MAPLFVAIILFGILSLGGIRWAYYLFISAGLLYFPIRAGFELSPRACQLALDLSLVSQSLTNYGHLQMFALFFLITSAQVRMDSRSGFVRAGVATVIMGALVEAAQGITGAGNCRLRDLIPDTAGAFLGAVLVLGWQAAVPLLRDRHAR